MSSPAPLSIEVGHMYLDLMDEEVIAGKAEQARLQLDQYGRSWGKKASKVVLIDDYNRFSAPAQNWEAEEAQKAVVAAFEEQGVQLDHVVWEASLVETVEHMLGLLVPQPRRGDGSRGQSNINPIYASKLGWLSNGDPSRPPPKKRTRSGGHIQDRPEDLEVQYRGSRPQHRHSIALDIQLWSDDHESGGKVWSCPTLAAWWQLVRLGALEYLLLDGPSFPNRTWSRPGANPLHARRSMTFLSYDDYLQVEHAVWNILRQLVLPETWAQKLGMGGDAPPLAHMNCIGYVFEPASDRA